MIEPLIHTVFGACRPHDFVRRLTELIVLSLLLISSKIGVRGILEIALFIANFNLIDL
jgi:hypothetical protein